MKFKIELLFPLAVILLSLISLYDQTIYLHYPALVVSIIGLIGGLLYFLKVKFYSTLIYIWIFSQIIIIGGTKIDPNTNQFVANKIWDTSQFLRLQFGYTFTTFNSSQNGIYINFVPFFLFGLLRILSVSDLIGEKIVFRKYRKDNRLGNIFPFEGIVKQRVNLSNEKDWLLIELLEPINYRDLEINHAFIKSNDKTPLKKGGKGQMAYFKIVENIEKINFESTLDKDDFKYIDIVKVE